MKKMKALAIIIMGVCGFYFTSIAQTETQSSDQNKQNAPTTTHSTMQSTDQQKSDDVSLNSSPTIEKSSQGYKIQVWVLPEESTNMEFDKSTDVKDTKMHDSKLNKENQLENKSYDTKDSKMYDSKGNKMNDSKDSKLNKDINKDNTSIYNSGSTTTTGSDISKSSSTSAGTYSNTGEGNPSTVNSSTTGTTGTAGTTIGGSTESGISTNPSGTITSPSGSISAPSGTISSPSGSISSPSGTITSPSGSISSPQNDPLQNSKSTDKTTRSSKDWRQSSNKSGHETAMNSDNDKSRVFVKVIDEKTGKQIPTDKIEMKVITPSKRSFTTDLREKGDHAMGELALTEDGTYNIQTTIKTEDNKSVVIPFTYDNEDFDQK